MSYRDEGTSSNMNDHGSNGIGTSHHHPPPPRRTFVPRPGAAPPPRTGLAYVSYEDEQVYRIQPVNYEKTITIHKSKLSEGNHRFADGKLKVHDEVEYDREGSGPADPGALPSSGIGVSLTSVPPGTIAKRGYALSTGVVARVANDKFGFIKFNDPDITQGNDSNKPGGSDIFFQLGGCINAYETFDTLKAGVEIKAVVVDSTNQPGKKVAVYVHTTGRVLDPPPTAAPPMPARPSYTAPLPSADRSSSIRSSTSDIRHERPRSLREEPPPTDSMYGRDYDRDHRDRDYRDSDRDRDHRDFDRFSRDKERDYARDYRDQRDIRDLERDRDYRDVRDYDRDRGRERDRDRFGSERLGSERFGSEREERYPVAQDSNDLAGWVVWLDRNEGSMRPTNSQSEFRFALSDAYAQIHVGDEVVCRRESRTSEPLVYAVKRMSNREPPLSRKCWSYGRISTIDDSQGWIIDDDTGERVEMQRNQLSPRYRERDPVVYLPMAYKNRQGRTKIVAALVEEDVQALPRGAAAAAAAAAEEDRFSDRPPIVPRTSQISSARDPNPMDVPVGDVQEGWITSLQDSFGILRLIGNQRTYFFHFKSCITRFEDFHKFDCVRCIVKPDGNASQVEKLSYQLPLSPPDWKKGQIIELDGGGGLLVDSTNPNEKFDFKIHALKGRGIQNLDHVLYLLVDSPKYGKNFVAMMEVDPDAAGAGAVGGGGGGGGGGRGDRYDDDRMGAMPSGARAPRGAAAGDDRGMSAQRGTGGKVQEGWITSLQDSFGILRLVGDQATHFFHIRNCISNFNELRNGNCVRCTLKPDGSAQFVEKLPYQLPLDPPDWKPGRILEMGDAKGRLVDTETQQHYDFKNSVIKGTIQAGTSIFYLLVDSPKYGKNFVATVVPDRGPEGNKSGIPQSSPSSRRAVTSSQMIPPEQPHDVSGGDYMMGWVVELLGDEGSFRATEFEGEWRFNMKDADPDVREGDEVSCRRDRGNDPVVYAIKRLTNRDPPLPIINWKFGKIESITDEQGWIVDNAGERIMMHKKELTKQWRDHDPVKFLKMIYPDRSAVAVLIRSDMEVAPASTSDAPPHERSSMRSVDPNIKEGWITSLQDSFGFIRLIGDQQTHFFHMDHCRSSFQDMRIGDCARCTIEDGQPREVERVAYELPLDPPDWNRAKVLEFDDRGGKLLDQKTGNEFDFTRHSVDGKIEVGGAVVYLLVDSPKYGKDYITMIRPCDDSGRSKRSRSQSPSQDRSSKVQRHDV